MPLQKPKHKEQLNNSLKKLSLINGPLSQARIDPYLRMEVKPAQASKIKTRVIYLLTAQARR